MINLLPKKEREASVKEYHRRLLIVGVVLLLFFLIICLALIFPTEYALKQNEQGVSLELDTAKAPPISKQADDIKTSLVQINTSVDILGRVGSSYPIVELIDIILSHKSSGIDISQIQVASLGATMIKGRATKRTVLLNYVRSLETDPRVGSVESPVSNLI